VPPRKRFGGVPWWPEGYQAVVPWPDQPLTRSLALATAHIVGWADLGECQVVPPSGDQPHWVVLVYPPDGGEPAVLGTVGAAAPLLRRAFHTRKLDEAARQRIGEATRLRHAEAQVRRELGHLLAKEEAEERLPRAKRREVRP
jgi:hypothetical protein